MAVRAQAKEDEIEAGRLALDRHAKHPSHFGLVIPGGALPVLLRGLHSVYMVLRNHEFL